MSAKCITHKVDVVQRQETEDNMKVVVCPVDGCTTGFTHLEFISLFFGTKLESFGIYQDPPVE